MKKTLLSIASAAALLGAAAPAYATSTFHLVVPLSSRTLAQEPVEAIAVSLSGAALPRATINRAYSESLRPYLSVTGDAAFDPAAASWSLVDGSLPDGLALDSSTGAVAGTPTAKTTSPASFTVLATYKGSDGQAVYTLEVGGVVLQALKVDAGNGHLCALTTARGVKCWGINSYGQLGDGTTAPSLVPVNVVGLTSGVKHLGLGDMHSCAVLDAGSVKCWGSNYYGQLGTGNTTNSSVPVNVTGLPSVASVSGGFYHTCVLTAAGGVMCWGYNANGQLGNGSTAQSSYPVNVTGLSSGVAGLDAGANFNCVLTVNGGVKCWGYNLQGQLGNNTTNSSSIPLDVSGLTSGVSKISAGLSACAVTTGGAAKCWGTNVDGLLGDGTTTSRYAPTTVMGLSSGVTSITTSYFNSCAVMASGGVKCWGRNGQGQLGAGSTINSSTPVDVVGLTEPVTMVSVAQNTVCAITVTNSTKCWGYSYGLGNGSSTSSYYPVDVEGL